jgi:hypothetical protein
MVAGPLESGRLIDDASANRIEMDVANELHEIGFCVDKSRVVAALEEVPGGFELALHGTGILCGDLAHGSANRLCSSLHQQMHVIAHPAIRVKSRAKLIYCARNDLVQQLAVAFGEENVSLVISTQRDVVEATRKV